ncbi:hypothetical protein BOTCAL_0379g00150 [Botryotinia calthae]|uniref:Uncharacterized protein n=1 Tax=Botryotinia calthae TaxID=38488 RepID=A0A4Y8CRH8_9HELO|nr:hypothetical protein BOTCAL_0379g00150 [Botryotinia calthae]
MFAPKDEVKETVSQSGKKNIDNTADAMRATKSPDEADEEYGNDEVLEEIKAGNEEKSGVEGHEDGIVADGEEYGREAGVDEEGIGFKCTDFGE